MPINKRPMTKQEAEAVLARFHICARHGIRMHETARHPEANIGRAAYRCGQCGLEQAHAERAEIEEAKKVLGVSDAR